MSEWKAKRFWKEVGVTEAEGGYSILLDARPLRSPHKTLVVLPNTALAEAVAEEWAAQQGVIDPGRMPMTRMANSALDKLAHQRAEVIGYLAGYAETDLLCYRATAPEALVARQAEHWEPVLDWAHRTFDARLTVVQGVMPVAQPEQALQRLAQVLHGFDDFALTGMHDLVSLSGSMVLALALTQGHLSVDQAWTLSCLDETWQAEQWGEDDESAKAAELKRAAFLDAWRFFRLSFGQAA